MGRLKLRYWVENHRHVNVITKHSIIYRTMIESMPATPPEIHGDCDQDNDVYDKALMGYDKRTYSYWNQQPLCN